MRFYFANFLGDKTRRSRIHRCGGRKTSVGVRRGKGERVKEIEVGGYGGGRRKGGVEREHGRLRVLGRAAV